MSLLEDALKEMERRKGKKKLKVLELFSGSQSISDQFTAAGHEVFTVDNFFMFGKNVPQELRDKTSLDIDINELTADIILELFGKPDVIWSSTPCTKFSVAAIGRNWIKGTETPKNQETRDALALLEHTVELVKELDPELYFFENPRGKMRKMECMQQFPRYTVTYCKYMTDLPLEQRRMKPTDIWTNHPNPNFIPKCENGAPCHVRSPRGSQTGTQGMGTNVEKAKIPKLLCQHIVKICEEHFEI